MAGYFLIDASWHDDELRTRYLEHVDATIEAYGGEFVARNPERTDLEGDWGIRGALIVTRFPTAQRGLEWYRSEAYAPFRELRHRGARTNMVFFEGA